MTGKLLIASVALIIGIIFTALYANGWPPPTACKMIPSKQTQMCK